MSDMDTFRQKVRDYHESWWEKYLSLSAETLADQNPNACFLGDSFHLSRPPGLSNLTKEQQVVEAEVTQQVYKGVNDRVRQLERQIVEITRARYADRPGVEHYDPVAVPLANGMATWSFDAINSQCYVGAPREPQTTQEVQDSRRSMPLASPGPQAGEPPCCALTWGDGDPQYGGERIELSPQSKTLLSALSHRPMTLYELCYERRKEDPDEIQCSECAGNPHRRAKDCPDCSRTRDRALKATCKALTVFRRSLRQVMKRNPLVCENSKYSLNIPRQHITPDPMYKPIVAGRHRK